VIILRRDFPPTAGWRDTCERLTLRRKNPGITLAVKKQHRHPHAFHRLDHVDVLPRKTRHRGRFDFRRCKRRIA